MKSLPSAVAVPPPDTDKVMMVFTGMPVSPRMSLPVMPSGNLADTVTPDTISPSSKVVLDTVKVITESSSTTAKSVPVTM